MAFIPGEIPRGAKPFKKGQSGNPAGRPKVPDISDALEAILSDVDRGKSNLQHVLEALIKRAKEGDIAAIRELFDRTYGRSRQLIDTNVSGSLETGHQVIKVMFPADKIELDKIGIDI